MNARTKRIAKIFLRPGTRRFRIARKLAVRMTVLPPPPPDIPYAEWVERTEPFLWTKPIKLENEPLISIVVPVFNTPARYLLPMVYSVVNQENYNNWELVLVNASTYKKKLDLTESCARIDTRIKVVYLPENKGIAGNTNFGISQASGEYIGLLDHDDLLAPRALFEVAYCLQRSQAEKPQLIYSDEDKTTEDGEHRFDAHFKPDWSPQLLRQVNYINHFTVIERQLLDRIGGYRIGFDGAQDYDLYLRLIDKKPRIAHIPKVLYHWRAAHNSTAQNFSSKKEALAAGIKALEEHLKRNEQKGKVSRIKDQPGFYNISYEPKAKIKVAVLVLPTRNLAQYSRLAKHLVNSLERTILPTEVFLKQTVNPTISKNNSINVKNLESANKVNFVKQAMKETSADILVLFNAAAIPKNKKWLVELAGILSQNENIGVVSPILLDPGGITIRDAGFVRHDGIAVGLFQGMALLGHTPFGNTVWSRNVDYLSGRVCAFRREVFEKYFENQAFYDRDNLYDAEPYKKLLDDGMEVIIFPQVQMEYRGELSPVNYQAPLFSPNLSIVRYEPGFARTINVPSEVENEK